jgi:hypothetical protein
MKHPLRRLALFFRERKSFANAARLLELGIAQIEKAGESNHPIMFRFANSLSLAYAAYPTSGKAKKFSIQALDGYSKIFGEESKWTMETKSNLFTIYIFQGRLDLAIELTESNLALFRIHPLFNRKDLEVTLSRLSWMYQEPG